MAQAHVLAALGGGGGGSGGINLNPGPPEQAAALVQALAELLWQARSGNAASVALPPAAERGSSLVHEQLMRGVTFVVAPSLSELQVG